MSEQCLAGWEKKFAAEVERRMRADGADAAHDLLHIRRVVATARQLCAAEGGNTAIVIPAAWLHDLVTVPKNDPRRSQASRMSAEAASEFLSGIGYPETYVPEIAHAIAAHSFSANIAPETLEAKIVQDADRLDGIGAIGIARCFLTSGAMNRVLYSEQDPFCYARTADDQSFTLDHFHAKLFKTAARMQTESGQMEGRRRAEVMRQYLADLERELG